MRDFSLPSARKFGIYADFPALFWYNRSIKSRQVLLLMMTQNADKKREQVQFLCMDDMVPQDHLLRIIDKAIDWNFIYDLVVEKYSQDNGRPSMDPVMLIKIPFIQYLYGIKSMRQTCKESNTMDYPPAIIRSTTLTSIFNGSNQIHADSHNRLSRLE